MIDTDYLKQHYALLSDQALQEVDRVDLVAAAQRVYDEEVQRRRALQPQALQVNEPAAGNERPGYDSLSEDGKPKWLEEASEAWSTYAVPAGGASPEVDLIRAALEAEGIPCYVDVVEEAAEDPEEKSRFRWRMLVPGEFNLRAASVIERDVYNDAVIEIWKNHLEMLSDTALRASVPEGCIAASSIVSSGSSRRTKTSWPGEG